MDTVNLWSLIASITSVVLALVAIGIAFYQKSESDRVNQKTQDVLIEIKTDAKAISQYAMPELQRYGDSMRSLVIQRNLTGEELPAKKAEANLNSSIEIFGKQVSDVRALLTSGEFDKANANKMESKLTEVEAQLKVLQESADRSWRESLFILKINYLGSSSSMVVTRGSKVRDILGGLSVSPYRLNPKDYGITWVLTDSKNGKQLGIAELDTSFAELGVDNCIIIGIAK